MSKTKNTKHELVRQPMPTNPKFIDRTGEIYSRLTVVGYAGRKGSNPVWDCQCSCGASVQVQGGSLTRGHTISCGCFNRDRLTTHGNSGSELYRTWRNMLARCRNPNSKDYPNYGARGITISPEFDVVTAFIEYVMENLGEKPGPGYTIDRIDNDKGYEPGNLRWATSVEQTRKRRNTLYLTLCGEKVTLKEACEIFSKDYQLVWQRLNDLHWPLVDALLTPVGKPRPIQSTP